MISSYVWRDFLGEQGFEISYLTPTVWATKYINKDLSVRIETDGQAVRLSAAINIQTLNVDGFAYTPFVLGANPGATGGAELVKVVGILLPQAFENVKAELEAIISAGERVIQQLRGLGNTHGRL